MASLRFSFRSISPTSSNRSQSPSAVGHSISVPLTIPSSRSPEDAAAHEVPGGSPLSYVDYTSTGSSISPESRSIGLETIRPFDRTSNAAFTTEPTTTTTTALQARSPGDASSVYPRSEGLVTMDSDQITDRVPVSHHVFLVDDPELIAPEVSESELVSTPQTTLPPIASSSNIPPNNSTTPASGRSSRSVRQARPPGSYQTSRRLPPVASPSDTAFGNTTLYPSHRRIHTQLGISPSSTSGGVSPPSSAASLQSHLYTSGLLNAALSDVQLEVFSHLYRLHRIVLCQSGYFSALLSGGFSEERTKPLHSRTSTGSSDDSDAIQIEMDLPMTRAAYEFCLARLYGGGPELIPPPWAKTTSNHPLSQAFEKLWIMCIQDKKGTNSLRDSEAEKSRSTKQALRTVVEQLDWDDMRRADVQAATPAFLLSLLSSSTYLEISSTQAIALQGILSTITPWTVGQYLGYACGKGLGVSSRYINTQAACRGLEGVGSPCSAKPSRSNTCTSASSARSSINHSITSSFDDIYSHENSAEQLVFVGPEGERVGEACACWLAKWGAEILEVEEWLYFDGEDEEELSPLLQDASEHAPPPPRVWSSLPGGLSARWVRGIISSDAFFLGERSTTSSGDQRTDKSDLALGSDCEFERYLFAKRVIELRRNEQRRLKLRKQRTPELQVRHSQKPSSAVNVDGKRQRVDIAISSLSLDDTDEETEGDGNKTTERRHRESMDQTSSLFGERDMLSGQENEQADDDEDEKEYMELFTHGIHYSHMTFKQLRFIAEDCSPATMLPYVPQTVIERAFWQSEEFRAQIPVGSPAFATVSHATYSTVPHTGTVPDTEKDTKVDECKAELGLAYAINPHLDEAKSSHSSRRFFLIPIDNTTRINDGPLPGTKGAIDGLAKKFQSSSRGVDSFFGLALETRLGLKGVRAGVFGTEEELIHKRQFVPYEPCRFSAEFWGVGDLRDKQRLYSQTFFYAGSFYNLYLQKIHKKGVVQLGIYLHRQNQLEPFPTASRSSPNNGTSSSPSLLSEAFGSRTSLSTVTGTSSANLGPYIDRRPAIQAFFSIWCPNSYGTSSTKFSSGPDSFAMSQSWGWKSSSLRSQEYIGTVTEETTPAITNPLGSRFNSLRVSLVMGVV